MMDRDRYGENTSRKTVTVTTRVLLESNDIEEAKEFAQFMSYELNVVTDQNFANLKPESGPSHNKPAMDDSLLIKVTKEEKQAFMDWCERNDFTASKKFRKWMREAVQGERK